VADVVTEAAISHEGGRALVVARGEIFTVPREHGATRNLSRSSGTRERGARWSPVGDKIAFVSDRTGEYQLYVGDVRGVETARQITDRDRGYPHTLRWSPDGEKIAFTDETLTLYVIDVATKRLTTVDRAPVEPMDISLEAKPISDHSWSPDSRWLTYSKIGMDQVANVYVYSLDTGTTHNVSSGLFNDFGPVFTADGRHLVFISNRRFNPTYGDFEWEMVYKRMAGIYALTLSADGEALLPPLSDESAAVPRTTHDGETATPDVAIDFDGITDRIQALPVDRGNYRSLAAGIDRLFFLNADEGDFNFFEFRSRPAMDLVQFTFSTREEKTLETDVDSYAMSADRKHLILRKGESIAIWDTEPGHRPQRPAGSATEHDSESRSFDVDLSDLDMVIDPPKEWRQVYWEAWRLQRDYFYDPNLHGLDWRAVGEHYGGLLDGVSCAQDLRFLIGELIGELATSHTYIRTGERRRQAERVNVGMLGADWVADEDAGRYRVETIYSVPHWSRDVLPPLVGPGKDVRTGDYLISVDGRDVTTDRSIYAYFQGLAGKSVELEFSGRADGADSRTFVTRPVSGERTLRYLHWVEHNRRLVAEASDNRIGYLHFPDTYLGTSIEFPAYYYSQTTKEGLLVDGRFNGGGLDPDIFLNRMAKRPLAYWTRRYSEDQVTPVFVSNAHMALLTNRQAGSGGDELPHEFRDKGMGPVIGTRTWGGLVGVSMFIRLMNGASVTVPDYRIYTPDGQWTVENEGVTPDIEVELDPAEMADGHDAQLQKGIEVLLKAIENDPRQRPEHPPFPVRD
jgi:tricorn protease